MKPMSHIKAVAISPDKKYLVVQRGKYQYALLNRKKGAIHPMGWRDKSLLSSMIIKGNYTEFPKPVNYKGDVDKVQKSRKSVGRLDKPKHKGKDLVTELGLENLRDELRATKSESLYLDLQKADNSHLPKDAERFSYNCTENYNIIYIPVNRLKEVYQTDEALDSSTINRKAKEMKDGKPMPPISIGYDYDIHDGHHTWNAAMKNGYTHVPCKVVGTDPDKVKGAIAKYKKVWKSEKVDAHLFSEQELKDILDAKSPRLVIGEKDRIDPFEDEELWKEEVDKEDKEFRSKIGINKNGTRKSLIIDLEKGMLHKGKLVKRRVAVRGKNGRTFYRMQWVDPHKPIPGMMRGEGQEQTTYSHHEEGIKEMERRQSNRFPVVHPPVGSLNIAEHNYHPDEAAIKEAEEKYHKGEKLPPLRIDPYGKVLNGHHLLEMAKRNKLSHVPAIVVGNPNLKKQYEDRLKDRVIMEDNKGNKSVVGTKDSSEGLSEDQVTNLNEFNNFTKKKYTKQYLMDEARRQGIVWNEKTKDGRRLPENSSIMWMRAHQAIEEHIKSGKTFEVRHDEKDVDKRMQQDGKDTIHKHFLKLLQKHGSKDDLMEWARKNGIKWKEKSDPDINWMYATVAIKNELAKGRMLDGIRTRQKKAMEDANLIVSPEIKDMVKTLGKKYGKANVMKRADSLGIEYLKTKKNGDPLPANSSILWMRAHEAISKYIAKGNDFKMGDEQDNGIQATVGDYGGVKLSKMQSYAVDLAKRKSQNLEQPTKQWATKSIALDFGVDENEANRIYEKFMTNARNAKLMVHFDPFEMLPNGSGLIEQFSSDGEVKNDYLLDRGLDRERRESNENDMFGDDYSDATDEERPVYGVIDLFNKGLRSHPYNGEVAFVLKDDVKKRATGSHIDSDNIPYGQEGKTVRSMEDPHQLLADRWISRWKNPRKKDGQRKRAFESIINGKEYKDDNKFFETQIHGGVNFSRDVDHILVPSSWKHSDNPETELKHDTLKDFAELNGLELRYDSKS